MGNELVPIQQQTPFHVESMMVLAKAMAGSGFFPDLRDANKALTKMVIGHELGFGPAASITGIHLIQGKPTLGANLFAALVKRSNRYDYAVTELKNNKCVLTFYEKEGKKKTPVGTSTFDEADAKAAGLLSKDNWRKFPRNMYFARALTNGVRLFCPDLIAGSPIYTPEELGADVDEDGDVIEVEPGARSISALNKEDLIVKIEETIKEVKSDRGTVLSYLGVEKFEDSDVKDLTKALEILESKRK